MKTTNKSFEYIEKNKDKFLEELKSFLRFESVSAQTAHKTDIIKCALWLKDHFKSLGLEAGIVETAGNPIVRASIAGKSKKRLIIYGHYDVQPPEPISEWISPPFEPMIRDGQIYARGATDDKGQLFAHIKGIETVLKTGSAPSCEIQFLLEGEEECGGNSLSSYVKNNKAELSPYAVVVSDGTMYRRHQPAIAYGLRGIIGFDIIIKGAKQDLHSGSFGGAVPNPVVALANILAKCVDADGNVLIPGFYDDVIEMQQWEQDNLKHLAFDDKNFCDQIGIKKILGRPDVPALAKIWARPTFEINGIYGGYSGQGGKTIIPSQAAAKISARLVPAQNPEKLAGLMIDYIKNICPDNVSIEFIGPGWASPVLFDVSHPIFKTAEQALKSGFNSEPVYIREGGSIPVAETFFKELNAPVLLMGFGSEYDGAHAPNEHFSVEHFINAIKTSAHLMENII
jgi:acetylornithine deacetylase/succinyl-diaminopimelate desuccinylase-like protein